MCGLAAGTAWRRSGRGSTRPSWSAEVDRITEDCGQQQRPVFGLGPVLQVGEVAAEARPVVHVHQQFGDLDARQ